MTVQRSLPSKAVSHFKLNNSWAIFGLCDGCFVEALSRVCVRGLKYFLIIRCRINVGDVSRTFLWWTVVTTSADVVTATFGPKFCVNKIVPVAFQSTFLASTGRLVNRDDQLSPDLNLMLLKRSTVFVWNDKKTDLKCSHPLHDILIAFKWIYVSLGMRPNISRHNIAFGGETNVWK